MAKHKMMWKVHTKGLLREIISTLEKKDYTALHIPIKQFTSLLIELGARASELNDPKLNAIMCRLQLYAESDPENKEYNLKLVNKVIADGYKTKKSKEDTYPKIFERNKPIYSYLMIRDRKHEDRVVNYINTLIREGSSVKLVGQKRHLNHLYHLKNRVIAGDNLTEKMSYSLFSVLSTLEGK
jgi:hypothetical protein